MGGKQKKNRNQKGKQQAKKATKKPPEKAGSEKKSNIFPTKFPFWARLKLNKNRTTLVIDEEEALNKKSNKVEDSFVHREATHTKGRGEAIIPNPDKDDPDPMYLKSPSTLPKRLFKPHNKDLDMPEELRQRYEKNNHKGDKKT